MPLDVPLAPDWQALLPQLVQAEGTLGLSLTDGQRHDLLAYGALIQRWTQVYNLTAVRSTGEMFTHHLLDCLAILPALDRVLAGEQQPVRLLDVGSGAGLPGAVLAILRPEWQVTCVDAVIKKISFIRQAAAELSLRNLAGVHGRVETPGLFGDTRFRLITSRAFASLHDFTQLTQPLLGAHGQWVAMKAHVTDAERAELPATVQMFHVEQLRVPGLDAARCLVWLQPSNSPEAPTPSAAL